MSAGAPFETAVSEEKSERQTDILRYTDRQTHILGRQTAILDVPEGSCDN